MIPDSWELRRLAEVADVRGGIAKNTGVRSSDPVSVPYLRVANVQDGFLDLSEVSKIELSRQDLARYSLQPGDVLMNEGGDRDKLGRGAVWGGQVTPCVHQNHVFAVRCRPALSPLYLNVWTRTRPARQFFLLAGKQTTNLASISKSSLGELPLALPPVAEQRAIAAALSDVDALLDGLDRLIAKKRDLKQAAMRELLTGQVRLPGFSGKWETQRLGGSAQIKARIGWQGLTTREYRSAGGHLLVTGTEIRNGRIEWDRCKFVDEERYDQDKYIQLRDGDVLVTKDGTIGKVAFVADLPKPATLNSGVFVVRPLAQAFCPEFFFCLLSSRAFEKFLEQLSAGSTINHLYQKDFVTFSYQLPPTVEEQSAIASVIFDMDAELTALEVRRDKTRALKQGMMQELLTGRTRLV